jgi:hypothetical protein
MRFSVHGKPVSCSTPPPGESKLRQMEEAMRRVSSAVVPSGFFRGVCLAAKLIHGQLGESVGIGGVFLGSFPSLTACYGA